MSSAESYLTVILQIGSTVIIARLLTPEQIGVFAIAAVFASLASSFRDFGVAEYLIQERELTRSRIAAAFGLNVIVSWSMALLLLVLSPLAARFYGEPGVGEVMRIQAVSFLLVPFGAITLAWYRRELRYGPIAISNVLSALTSAIVAVALAWNGAGHLSLAWAALASILAVVLAAAWFRPAEVPAWPSFRGMGEVFRFGKWASATYLVAQLGRGAPELVLGRTEGAVAVGLYSRGNGLVELFNRLTMNPLLQICMPYFAQQHREQGSLPRVYAHSVGLLTALGWPFLATLAVLAFPGIRVIYGSQWTEAVVLAQVLCLAGALDLAYLLAREALMAHGQARRTSTMQLQFVALKVAGLLASVPFGLLGACWGLVAASTLSLGVSLWHLRSIGLRPARLFSVCVPSLWLALIVAGPPALVAAVWPPAEDNYVLWALAGATWGTVAWLSALRLLRHPLLHEISRLVAPLLARWRPGSPPG
ncbi:MAG: lipopolysaccharide biosynthesis protein [Betaproteobacteria bacterium]|jgi:O-antigen/teichoic acid export membrane protein|nr:lipopolysaccharide biosynthesis protein [Rubrivivax sp.]